MDIYSKSPYPSCALSNFACHPFVIDGVECNSMEGFLQALKFKDANMQKEICKLVGIGAKRAGYNKNWRKTRNLYWQGVVIPRDSDGYQFLLNRAYNALNKNPAFRKALLSTKGTLTHNIGKGKQSETILTRQEFCSRLMHLRDIGDLPEDNELFA